jgi:DNA modification methylase
VLTTERWTVEGGVPVVEIEADDEKDAAEKLLLLSSTYGKIDEQGVYEFTSAHDISLAEWDLSDLPDFDLPDYLEGYYDAPHNGDAPPDEIPEVAEESVTWSGDLWVLGEHRVLCGDCTIREEVDRLITGVNKPELTFTSPPYNMGANADLGNTALTGSKYSEYMDDLADDEYEKLLTDSVKNCIAISEVVIFNLQLLAKNKRAILSWLNEMRGNFIDVAVWDKINGAPQMAEKVLNSRFEFLFFFCAADNPTRAISSGSFRGTVDNVYAGHRQMENANADKHAASFPAHLVRWAFDNFSKSGPYLDPFLGTGTTLIESQQRGAVCFGIELSPVYVDVAIRRWQDYTGQEATLDSDGRTFAEVAQERRGEAVDA